MTGEDRASGRATMDRITQDEVDALWLACQITIPIGDVPRNLRPRAQLRFQRLCDAGVIKYQMGKWPECAPSTPQGED